MCKYYVYCVFLVSEKETMISVLTHHLKPIPAKENKAHPAKRCRVCFKEGRRKEYVTVCAGCPGKPGLCVHPCFVKHHQAL